MDNQESTQVEPVKKIPVFYLYLSATEDRRVRFNITSEPVNYSDIPELECVTYTFPKFTDEQRIEFEKSLEDDDVDDFGDDSIIEDDGDIDEDDGWDYFALMFKNTPPYTYIDYESKFLGKIKLAVWHNFSTIMPRFAVMIKYGDEYKSRALGDIVNHDNNLNWHRLKASEHN
jgi:hypothetical protein